jgi:hypothetical protein
MLHKPLPAPGVLQNWSRAGAQPAGFIKVGCVDGIKARSGQRMPSESLSPR